MTAPQLEHFHLPNSVAQLEQYLSSLGTLLPHSRQSLDWAQFVQKESSKEFTARHAEHIHPFGAAQLVQ